VDLDTEAMVASIPEDKVTRTVAAIASARAQGWVGVREVMTLLGLLGFCGQVLVCGGWRVPWTVGALRQGAKQGFARMHSAWAEELEWWRELLTVWNGRALLVPPIWKSPGMKEWQAPYTDASRELGKNGGISAGGAGAVFGQYAMTFQFTQEELRWLPICDTEGLVLVLWLSYLCESHASRITGTRFVMWCDNQSFLKAVNKRRSNAPTLAYLLGRLHMLQARYSFDLRVEYVRSEDNVAADAASREEWERFYVHMLSVGYDKSAIVWVPVQVALRSSMSSKLRSLRILQGQLTVQQLLE